jgi:hypothetical protein
MSNKLKQSLSTKKDDKARIWSLTPDLWQQMEMHLLAAERIYQEALEVTPAQYAEWTAEFSEGQGFHAIIYHDKPIIPRPMGVDKNK